MGIVWGLHTRQPLIQEAWARPDSALPTSNQVVVTLLVPDHTSSAFGNWWVLPPHPPAFPFKAPGRCEKRRSVPPLPPLPSPHPLPAAVLASRHCHLSPSHVLRPPGFLSPYFCYGDRQDRFSARNCAVAGFCHGSVFSPHLLLKADALGMLRLPEVPRAGRDSRSGWD